MDWKSEDGAIIVEATISLSTFMFFIVTLLTIVNICYVQSKMGIAINETAKEISQYSYLYGITGLNQKQQDLASKGEAAKETTENIVESVGGLVTVIEDTKSEVVTGYKSMESGNFTMEQIKTTGKNIYDNIESGKASVEVIESELSGIAEDPVAFIKGLAALFGNGIIDEAKSHFIAAPVAKLMSKRHFKSASDGDCETFLKGLGVVPKGDSYLNGINFTKSKLFPSGKNDIKIVAVYRAKIVPLLPIDMKFTFCQTAETKGWFGAD